MEWSDQGIVLSSRLHSETGLVGPSLLTRTHGRHAGFIHGGVSRKSKPIWQPGNVVEVAWRARVAEQLGNFTGEVRELHAARVLDDPMELSGLAAACAMADAALPEREPHPAMYEGFHAFLGALGHPGWPAIYVRLELGLLQELGFGLDLEKCALTGDDRRTSAFVSPKTGRAVSRAAAEPVSRQAGRPATVSIHRRACRPTTAELRQGLDLTGFFLERHVFWPHNKPLPAARARFMETLQRQEQQ